MRTLILLAIALAVSLSTVNAQTARSAKGRAGQIIVNAGAPVNGTDEVQTITIGGTPTAGSFTLSFKGFTSGAITWSATNNTLIANIDAALEAMPNIGTGGVTTAVGSMTAGIGTATVTFTGNNAKLNVDQMTSTSSLTGTAPTLAVTTTTPGVSATGRGSDKGTLLVDSTNGLLYLNTGTALAPTWSRGGDSELATLLAAIPTAAVADLGALTSAQITGGEAPTEAEYNALQTDAAALRTKLNALLDVLQGVVLTP